MARGVRREKSKLAGGIELFAVSDVVIGEGKGELGVLTSSRLVHFYHHIIEDYDRLQFGYEIISLITKASETVDEPEWYDLLAELLMALDNATIALPLTKAWFYLRYSALLGHQLNLERDTNGKKLEVDARYRYDSAEQGLVQTDAGPLGGEHVKLLRLIATRPLAVLIQVGGLGNYLPECLLVAREHAAI